MAGGVDQLLLDNLQRLRAEQRRDVRQAAEHAQQQWWQRQRTPERGLRGLREDRSSQLFDNVRFVMCQMWWRETVGWSVMTSQAFLKKCRPAQIGRLLD